MPRTLSHHSEQMSGNSGFLKIKPRIGFSIFGPKTAYQHKSYKIRQIPRGVSRRLAKGPRYWRGPVTRKVPASQRDGHGSVSEPLDGGATISSENEGLTLLKRKSRRHARLETNTSMFHINASRFGCSEQRVRIPVKRLLARPFFTQAGT